jgi:Tol biopolymer transport system component
MTPERWQQVKQIFHAALEREPAVRSAFLGEVCGTDRALRSEVESLISSHEEDGSFIDSPAFGTGAGLLAKEPAALQPRQQLGAYEIVSLLGKGGMGEVYLASDRRLGRRVAIKILPDAFTHKVERLRRFEQEARAASALNHPNIITIHEIGEANGAHFIATEHIEGETLRRHLRRAQMSVDESLRLAIQIADALAAAHKAGIIHRDIKPENVMLRPDGYVKVLDFGLAKLTERQTNKDSDPEAPTLALVNTNPGVVMGTVNYMSPEQARGLEVDARTDIFSLGVVLYEMIAGREPFAGETPTDTLSNILHKEPPPLARFVAGAPPELERIVAKALRKDREERYQVVKDLLLDLKSLKQELEFTAKLERSATPALRAASDGERASQEPIETKTYSSARTNEVSETRATATSALSQTLLRGGNRLPLLALAALVIASVTFGLYKFLGRHQSATSSAGDASAQAPVVANISRVTVWSGLDTQPTLSPDGNSVAYSSNHNGSFEIYIKQLTPGGREIQLTSDGQENFQPAWSPDGQRIVYYSKRRGGIWVVPTLGGAARQLTEFGSGPAWSHDGATVAFQSDSSPDLGSSSIGSSTIWTVAAQGGTPQQITQIGHPAGGHVSATWSPDNRRIAFLALNFVDQEIWSVPSNGGEPKQMTTMATTGKASYPLYGTDRLYYVMGSTVFAVSIEDGEPKGTPLKITDGGASIINSLTISADGRRLAYSVQTLTSNIWSVPVSPKTDEATGPPQPLTNQTGTRNNQPAFSPDGSKIAFMEYLRGGGADIWVADADGKNPAQVTTNTRDLVPSWFPDGDEIAFTSYRGDHRSVWATSLGNRRDHVLFDDGRDIPYARLSPDGRQLAFNRADKGITNIWTVTLPGGQPKQLTFDHELAGFPCWSPDGKFIAFQLKRGDDAYLMIMPSDGGEPTQLTSGHGRSWPYTFSPDGDKILFAGERDGVWNVSWFSRSTKQQKQLTNYTKLNSFVRYPAWSPLGTRIAYEYAETNGNIWMLDLK